LRGLSGPIYYWSVQAIDGAFEGSPWAPERVIASAARLKAMPDTASVTSSGVVTAVFGDTFYIETPDRISGVQVRKTSHGVAVGDWVTARGTMQTEDGERYLAATKVSKAGRATVPAPYALNMDAIGGGVLGQQAGVTDWRLVEDPITKVWSRRLFSSGGANNVGLLVKITGQVKHRGDGFFYLNGACSFDDGDESRKGIRTAWPFGEDMPADGSQVEITAISSCTVCDGHVVRLLRPVSALSVVVHWSPIGE
jgi:hypothetical protein